MLQMIENMKSTFGKQIQEILEEIHENIKVDLARKADSLELKKLVPKFSKCHFQSLIMIDIR